jgi:outer membrane protein W
MKKQCFTIGLAFALLAIFNQNLHAQSFEKGKTFVSLGYGLAHLGTLHRSNIVNEGIVDIRMDRYGAIPIVLQVEHGFTDSWSLGLAVSYERYAYEYSFIPLLGTQRFNRREDAGLISAIARGNWHFGKKESRFDPYLGIGLGVTYLGYNIDRWSWAKGYHPTGELRLGGRYFFSKNIGAQLEIGLGSIFVQTGLTAKF